MQTCNFNQAAVFRLTLTLVIFVCLARLNLPKKKIVLALLMGILDYADSVPLTNHTCTKTFAYQSRDKIGDFVTYLIAYYMFGLDETYLWFLLWRLVGVGLFLVSKKSWPLIICPDLMKEYLVYSDLVHTNDYLPILVFGKIGYEYYFHTVVNKSSY